MDDLNITRFKIIGIYGIDLTYLLKKENEKDFNAIRGDKTWLEALLKESETKPNRFGFDFFGSAESNYAKTNRDIRNTFSKYYEKNLMPLVFELHKKDAIYVQAFTIHIKCISIGVNGAITIIVNVSIENSDKITSTRQVIEDYYVYRKTINEKIHSCISEFIKLLKEFFNKFNNNVEFKEEKDIPHCFEQFASYYEIVDFDYGINGTSKKKIKEIYKDEEGSFLKPLVALFRMSKIDFNSYDIPKISDIKDNDCGNRENELWAINQDRLLRHYPYESSDKFAECFFLDIILGIEILLQQKIVLQYLNQWISMQRSVLRNLINLGGAELKVNETKINSLILEMANIYDNISDCFIIQRNTNHTFFNSIIEKSIICMHLKDILSSDREMITDLFSLLRSISSQITSRSMESLSILMLRLTKVMIIIMIIMGFLQIA